EGGVDRVTGFVPQQSQAPEPITAVDVAHEAPFELAQPRVRNEERNRDARRAVRRKPLFRQPHVRAKVEAATLEFRIKRLALGPKHWVVDTQLEIAKAQFEQRVVVELRPPIGMSSRAKDRRAPSNHGRSMVTHLRAQTAR